jgi:hypothetical protein
MTKVVRALMPAVVAVVLGPLIAGLMFCLLGLASYFFGPSPGISITGLFTGFGIYMIFSYLVGGPIALLAGLLVSIWMIWRRPSFIVAIVAAIIAVGLSYLADAIGISNLLVRNNLALMLVLAVIAASVCWLVMRRFVRTT